FSSRYGIIDIDKTRLKKTTRTLMMDIGNTTHTNNSDFSGKAIIVAHGRTTHTNNRRLHVIEIHFIVRFLPATCIVDQYILSCSTIKARIRSSLLYALCLDIWSWILAVLTQVLILASLKHLQLIVANNYL
ncbi:hypothetical protein ACJX0J_024583, partial [Zea mays]